MHESALLQFYLVLARLLLGFEFDIFMDEKTWLYVKRGNLLIQIVQHQNGNLMKISRHIGVEFSWVVVIAQNNIKIYGPLRSHKIWIIISNDGQGRSRVSEKLNGRVSYMLSTPAANRAENLHFDWNNLIMNELGVSKSLIGWEFQLFHFARYSLKFNFISFSSVCFTRLFWLWLCSHLWLRYLDF